MKNNKPKIIFVTGGIVSGIGKGASAASLGYLLKARGYKILPVKIDPYLNQDAGTMNPYQHGEVFVTKDGAETDLDLGHYERILNMDLEKFSNFTSGTIYKTILEKERKGDFLGKTIQVIPHVTSEIKRRIFLGAKGKKIDIIVVEIGGTVGDIEAEAFLEAARQLYREMGRNNVVFVHTVKIDYIFPSEEEKTKPIQQSVRLLREAGINPDFLVVRCKKDFSLEIKEKIALFTNVPIQNIIAAPNVSNIYEIPLNFYKQKMDKLILKHIKLPLRKIDIDPLKNRLQKIKNIKDEVKIGLVGKYVENPDAYISVCEALKHAGYELGVKVEIVKINSEKETKNLEKKLKEVSGILVPGGFGKRGIEGKIKAIKYAREKNVPFLGLCLGLQLAIVEFARNVLGLKRANSTEFDKKTPYPVIDILPEQKRIKNLGGTMRLGEYKMSIKKGTLVYEIYKSSFASERHRHRYEVNPRFHKIFLKSDLIFSAYAKNNPKLIDMIELKNHPFFVATQAHPEFKSKFLAPHPLFIAFIKASLRKQ